MTKKNILNIFSIILICGSTQAITADTIDINGPSSSWIPTLYGSLFDGGDDSQAGSGGIDLIGNATHPLMYTQYDDKGTDSDEIDDEIGFRLRVNGPESGNYLFIGVDADADGDLDLFISIDGTSKSAINLWNPGIEANNSPSTTSIAKDPESEERTNGTNYSFLEVVSISVDPSATPDVGLDGKNDYFSSFKLLFSTLKQVMFDVSGITITKSSELRYMTITSKNTKALNGDFGGIDDNDKTLDKTLTFDELGMYTPPVTAEPLPAAITSPDFTANIDYIDTLPTVYLISNLTTEGFQQAITFSIIGGADQILFVVDPSTGLISLPKDNLIDYAKIGDDLLEVEIQATDGANTATQVITIELINLSPVVEFELSITDNTLYWMAKEEIGVLKYKIFLNSKLLTTIFVTGETKEYSYELPKGVDQATVSITVVDKSGFSQKFYAYRSDRQLTNYELNRGWNLISITGDHVDLAPVRQLGDVWGWNGSSYKKVKEATCSQGLWVHSTKQHHVTVVSQKSEINRNLSLGWNLLGPTNNVLAPEVTTIYTWSNSYSRILENDSILLQGVGYWFYSTVDNQEIDLNPIN